MRTYEDDIISIKKKLKCSPLEAHPIKNDPYLSFSQEDFPFFSYQDFKFHKHFKRSVHGRAC